MINPRDSRLMVTEDSDRLTIREIDPAWRLMRILASAPFTCLGLFISCFVLSGAGMAEANSTGQWVARILFLGFIGLIFGIVPLWVGLRIWWGREEIIILSTGGFEKSLRFGSWHVSRTTLQPVRSTSFQIRTRYGTKTGVHHEVVLCPNVNDTEIYLLSLKQKPDAEQWLQRISSFLESRSMAAS